MKITKRKRRLYRRAVDMLRFEEICVGLEKVMQCFENVMTSIDVVKKEVVMGFTTEEMASAFMRTLRAERASHTA